MTETRRTPWRRAPLVAGNLLAFGLLIALLEGGASLLVPVNPSFARDFRLNHTWPPEGRSVHYEWVAANPDFPEPYVHVYNRQAWLRESDVAREKAPGTFRIFYVGDSFTEGTVPMDRSVPGLVEKELNRRGAANGFRFEVINTGTTSYSPTIFYVLVRYVLSGYSPDLIVANVDMTDDFDDWKYSYTLLVDGEGNPWAVPPRDGREGFIDTGRGAVRATAGARLRLYLYEHSHLYNLILSWKKGSREAKPPVFPGGEEFLFPRWAWCRKTWDPATERNAAHTLDMVRRLARYCRGKGIRLVLTTVPHYWQYAGQADGGGEPLWSDRPHREIARVAAEEGVPYIDSFSALSPLILGSPQGRYYYNGDVHFNPRGYDAWARVHIGFLTDRKNRLLPESVTE